MAISLYQMRAQLAAIGEELRSATEEVREMAANSAVKIDELRAKKNYQNEVQERFNLLSEEIRRDSEAAEKRMAEQEAKRTVTAAGADEQRAIAATAEFIRAGFIGGGVSEETRNLLGAIPATDASGGEKLLPVNMQNTLVHEPFATNPLRNVVATSSIRGLELPKIAYEIDDDAFITDADTAKEMELTGDTVSFGRFKSKIMARISDTVMHGTDADLTAYVQNALNSGLAAKEKGVMLTAAPNTGEEHMSFYATQNAIAQISGTDLYEAVTAALADLNDNYRENAKIVMRFADYLAIIKTLANGNAALYTAQPESVLGKPVVFCDAAVNPIVGDFNYARLNYDGQMLYDNDKDVKAGQYLFVITAWFDVQILLKSAFRIAMLTPAP